MKRRNRRVGIVVIAGAAIVLAGALGLLGPVSWLFDHTVVPAGRGLTGAGTGTGSFFHTLGQLGSLARDNASLTQENEQLRAQLAALGEVKQENIELRAQAGLNAAAGWQTVGADIVAYQPDSYRQYLTIDRGSNDGLKVGQAATSNGLLIGEVSATTATTAKIMLLADPEFRLAVRDQDTSATGVLSGQLGAGLVMDKISQTDQVHAGDTVVASGLGGGMPAGLAIGRIETVNSAANTVFQSAAISPSADLGRLRLIFIIKTP